MNSKSIHYEGDPHARDYLLRDLMNRCNERRSRWTDIHKGDGVYVIYHIKPEIMAFSDHTGQATFSPASCDLLKAKWLITNQNRLTDIVYIGKGNVRQRVRSLVRYGLGRAINHTGGAWIWQISSPEHLRVLVSSCPSGYAMKYEKGLIDKFIEEHGSLPFANRKKGEGTDIWLPNIQPIGNR